MCHQKKLDEKLQHDFLLLLTANTAQKKGKRNTLITAQIITLPRDSDSLYTHQKTPATQPLFW